MKLQPLCTGIPRCHMVHFLKDYDNLLFCWNSFMYCCCYIFGTKTWGNCILPNFCLTGCRPPPNPPPMIMCRLEWISGQNNFYPVSNFVLFNIVIIINKTQKGFKSNLVKKFISTCKNILLLNNIYFFLSPLFQMFWTTIYLWNLLW